MYLMILEYTLYRNNYIIVTFYFYCKGCKFTINQRLFTYSYNILSSHIHNILTTFGHTSEYDICHVISEIVY